MKVDSGAFRGNGLSQEETKERSLNRGLRVGQWLSVSIRAFVPSCEGRCLRKVRFLGKRPTAAIERQQHVADPDLG